MVDKYRGGDLINIMKDCQKYADFSRADWYIQVSIIFNIAFLKRKVFGKLRYLNQIWILSF